MKTIEALNSGNLGNSRNVFYREALKLKSSESYVTKNIIFMNGNLRISACITLKL